MLLRRCVMVSSVPLGPALPARGRTTSLPGGDGIAFSGLGPASRMGQQEGAVFVVPESCTSPCPSRNRPSHPFSFHEVPHEGDVGGSETARTGHNTGRGGV